MAEVGAEKAKWPVGRPTHGWLGGVMQLTWLRLQTLPRSLRNIPTKPSPPRIDLLEGQPTAL
jgi:hypothetical protein